MMARQVAQDRIQREAQQTNDQQKQREGQDAQFLPPVKSITFPVQQRIECANQAANPGHRVGNAPPDRIWITDQRICNKCD
jgi:hypothetical protein